jgi:hypothetical protein
MREPEIAADRDGGHERQQQKKCCGWRGVHDRRRCGWRRRGRGALADARPRRDGGGEVAMRCGCGGGGEVAIGRAESIAEGVGVRGGRAGWRRTHGRPAKRRTNFDLKLILFSSRDIF